MALGRLLDVLCAFNENWSCCTDRWLYIKGLRAQKTIPMQKPSTSRNRYTKIYEWWMLSVCMCLYVFVFVCFFSPHQRFIASRQFSVMHFRFVQILTRCVLTNALIYRQLTNTRTHLVSGYWAPGLHTKNNHQSCLPTIFRRHEYTQTSPWSMFHTRIRN